MWLMPIGLPSPTLLLGRVESLKDLQRNMALPKLHANPLGGDALLDLIFVSSYYEECYVVNQPLVGNSDHDAQMLYLPTAFEKSAPRMTARIDYDLLRNLLQQIDWMAAFSQCVSADDYARQFTSNFQHAVATSTFLKPLPRRKRLPRHIANCFASKRKPGRSLNKLETDSNSARLERL